MTKTDQDRADFEAWFEDTAGFTVEDTAIAWSSWQGALAHERARVQGEPVAGVDTVTVDKAWRDLCEKDDRTSIDYPGFALIRQDELATYMLAAAPAAPPAESGETHLGWLYFNEGTGAEWSEQHPVESGEVPDATDVRPATLEALKAALVDAWEAAPPAPPPEPAKAEVLDAALWCAHVRGPDDVAAAASYDDAVALCDQINAIAKAYAHLDVMVVAYPALWPWDAQSHAANLAKGNDYRGPTLATPPTAPAAADVPPSALNEPDAWWAETGTSGAGDGCNKTFWLRHEAIAYVQQHGGHVAPLFRRWSDAAAADLGSAEPMILMPADATEEMLAATHDVNGHMRLLEFTNPEERSKPFLIMRACYRAMVDHVRKGGA